MKNKLVFFGVAALMAGFAMMSDAYAGKPGNIYHKGWIDFNKNGFKDIYEDPSRSVEERVADLLSQMTLEEKTCQLATLYGTGRVLRDTLPCPGWKNEIWKDGIGNIDEQYNGVGSAYYQHKGMIYPFSNHVNALRVFQKFFVEETRLGIPAEFSNEGIHGLNHTMATPLPAPVGLGCTWNRDLIRQAGEIAGMEARMLGYNSVYAPILDVARDQRWGRSLECYGEDPYLVAEMGLQMVRGIQSQGVGSGLKHYAAYSVPKGGRDAQCRTDPHITPRELHEIFLYPFRRVVQEAHPMVVMSSYNDWNGEPVSASHYFLTELLRDTYGFDGYVVSDSKAVGYVYSKHNVAPTVEDAVRQVLEAGLNVRTDFTMPEDFIIPARKIVREGLISEDVIDRRVREVLSVKFRMGLFDNPYTGDLENADKCAGFENHIDFARQICRESLVLLKNEGDLLPLDKSKLGKILVTGPLADYSDFMASRYGPNGLPSVTMLDGIRNYLGDDVEVVYEKGCEEVDERWPLSEIIPYPLQPAEKDMMEKAVGAAADADVIIAVMGEGDDHTGESRSRTSLELPGRQREFLMELHKTGKPIVLVLVNGQAETINWENAYLPAILETWFTSCVGGTVVAETLFGDYNPSGKLTVTFPKSIGQIEYNFPYKKGSHGGQNSHDPNGEGTTRVVGPLYPFGYGLSYTTFGYSDLVVRYNPDCTVDVSVKVTNTGKRAGAEVVQLYIRDKVSSVVTYDSVLRGFEKVYLESGGSTVVSFTLLPRDLQILDKQMQWTVEPGEFEVLVGASSTDIRLKGAFTVPEKR